MNQALYINGIFKGILEEILEAQSNDKELISTLQPHGRSVIKLLERNDFSKNPSITHYVSTTADLKHVSYVAEIVGWVNKRTLKDNPEELEILNEHIANSLPIQGEVHFHSDKEKTKECANLIELQNLRKLVIPLHVGNLIKTSDGTPYKARAQAGGWSPVHEVAWELMEANTSSLEETVQKELTQKVSKSLSGKSEVRKRRLKEASKKPEIMQIVSKGYKRNPDVIAEVLIRAKGICERCNSKAPFINKKDRTPYLEVHHKQTLAENGEDTVENSEALCPNCHREAHFGI